jgi:hypothetical protein
MMLRNFLTMRACRPGRLQWLDGKLEAVWKTKLVQSAGVWRRAESERAREREEEERDLKSRQGPGETMNTLVMDELNGKEKGDKTPVDAVLLLPLMSVVEGKINDGLGG